MLRINKRVLSALRCPQHSEEGHGVGEGSPPLSGQGGWGRSSDGRPGCSGGPGSPVRTQTCS